MEQIQISEDFRNTLVCFVLSEISKIKEVNENASLRFIILILKQIFNCNRAS